MIISSTFKNHIYTYRTSLYKQMKGGAIGLRLTGVLARIVMDCWAKLLKEALDKARVTVHMLEKYVDDVNLATSFIETGFGWDKEGGKEVFRWSQSREEKDQKDRQKGRTQQESTLERIREVSSRLVTGMIFTKDLPKFHPSGRVPILDISVWA